MNPKDPLLKQPAQHGQREVFDRLSRAADGFMGDQVAGGCVNLLVNVLRQSHSNWPAAERAFDELFGQTKQLLKNHLDEVLGTLSEREARVLKLRFGLEGNKQMTLEEVGKVFGVTRERIRQIEAKALRKLKHPSRRKKLQDYLD